MDYLESAFKKTPIELVFEMNRDPTNRRELLLSGYSTTLQHRTYLHRIWMLTGVKSWIANSTASHQVLTVNEAMLWYSPQQKDEKI
jgi:hypothetical protein